MTLKLAYPLSVEQLLVCPVAQLQGELYRTQKRREHKTTPFCALPERGEDLATGHKHCSWPTAFLSSWYLEKGSSFSKVSLALLETSLTTFPSSHPKWLILPRGAESVSFSHLGHFLVSAVQLYGQPWRIKQSEISQACKEMS